MPISTFAEHNAKRSISPKIPQRRKYKYSFPESCPPRYRSFYCRTRFETDLFMLFFDSERSEQFNGIAFYDDVCFFSVNIFRVKNVLQTSRLKNGFCWWFWGTVFVEFSNKIKSKTSAPKKLRKTANNRLFLYRKFRSPLKDVVCKIKHVTDHNNRLYVPPKIFWRCFKKKIEVFKDV